LNHDLLHTQSYPTLLQSSLIKSGNINMPVYHIGACQSLLFSSPASLTYLAVLFRLKPAVSPEQLSKFSALAKGMVGKIPGTVHVTLFWSSYDQHWRIGLLELKSGPPLPVTAHRAKGFDMGIVAVLEKPGDVEPYGTHPAHQEYVIASGIWEFTDDDRVHKMREELCDDTLAFDMEF
jgi:hypothetical protein